ncbi:hypothetical protein AB0E75_01675 [Streptomyces griseoviridis]|uniref:Uncharacterized protein n=1 Tax=Streptomyces griseoviridis TaxID=45398 RepID=A0A918G476_STRGD|nr:hypothetical protein [Streptomyces niveoruber]GGS18725.1 hypothetical protein GCM10010238_03550 [Streptomyces niveoruber]
MRELGGDRVEILVTLRPPARIMPSQRRRYVRNGPLTLAETETLRRLNVAFRARGLPDEPYSSVVRDGAVTHVRNVCAPGPDDARVHTPRWVDEAAAAIGAEMAGRISAAGVRVLGDPAPPSTGPAAAGPAGTEPRITPEVAARALRAALAAPGAAPPRRSRVPCTRRPPRTSSRCSATAP